MASGLVLTRVTELITSKVGGDNKTSGFLSTLITVATTVAAVAVTASTGGAAAPIATAAAKAGVALAGGMAQTAVNKLLSGADYSETSESMSIHQFKHKYLTSKTRPISLRVEYVQELCNQYRNRRELKGEMTYSYFNTLEFGFYLSQKGLLKASIVS